jgi:nucleoside 2-deoxyribosyltransferase
MHIGPETKCGDTVLVGEDRDGASLLRRRGAFMEAETVRKHAEAHAAANVSGDMPRAAADLTNEARANVGPVMRQLPRPITSGEVTNLREADAGRIIVEIRYSGADSSTTVESVWIEQEGKPMIAETRIV